MLASLTMLTFTSCDDDDEDKEPTRTDILTAEEWRGDAIFANGMDVTEDAIEWIGLDIRDSRIKFNKDGTYVTYLESVPDDTAEGEWEFTSNEQAIILDKGSADEETVNIKTLTDSDLVFQEQVEIPDIPVPVTAELRYTR